MEAVKDFSTVEGPGRGKVPAGDSVRAVLAVWLLGPLGSESGDGPRAAE